MKKTVLVNLLLIVVLLGLVDLGGYWLLPERAVVSLPGYRNNPPAHEFPGADRPQNYYIPDSVSGFDIGPRRRGQQQVDSVAYPVWSNDLGCFDDDHTSYGDYVYFAGDSFTWGYAPYDSKFGTLIERATGQQILKCGVEHTGQRQQFAKFVEITTRTASVPKAVFVFYFENDVANDYAYPHSTVVDGQLVDVVMTTPDHQLIHRTAREISAIVAAHAAEIRRPREVSPPPTRWRALTSTVRHYSLSASVLAALVHNARKARELRSGPQNFYTLPAVSHGSYWYRDNPFAAPNKAAILDFKRWTDAHHVPLVLILIPRHRAQFDPEFFTELHRFLKDHQIRFVDLAGPFLQRGLDPSALYWRSDPHFNRAGNAMVAAVLRDSFPQYFVPRPEPSHAGKADSPAR